MSIRSEIERISNAISAAYQAVTAKGGTIPQDLNLANLLASIASIKGVQTIVPSAESGSVAKQLLRISEDIASAYDICELSGATLPVQQTIANLANTINTIPTESWEWPGWNNATWEDINNLCVAKQRGWINTWPSDVVIGAKKRIRLPWDEVDYNIFMRVVGIDLDADGTLTFAPETLIGRYTFSQNSDIANYYSEYNNFFINNDESQCKRFYDYCTLKPYILPVLKGTCITSDSNRNGTAVYREQAVWLFSEMEVGLDTNSSISASNATLNNAECTYGKKFSYPGLNTVSLRTLQNIGPSETRWFLRGAYYQYSSATCIVNSNGGAAQQSASTSRGFLPGLVIGNPSAATI